MTSLTQHQHHLFILNNRPPIARRAIPRRRTCPPNLLNNIHPRPQSLNPINLHMVMPPPKPLLQRSIKRLTGCHKRGPVERGREDIRLDFDPLHCLYTLEDGLDVRLEEAVAEEADVLREVDDQGVVEGDCLLMDNLGVYICLHGVVEYCVAAPFHYCILELVAFGDEVVWD